MKTPGNGGISTASPSSEPDDAEAVASRFGLRHLVEIPDEILDNSLVSGLPIEWARSRCLLPVRIDGELCVLCADPSRIDDQEYLAILLGKDMRPVVSPRNLILSSIEKCYVSRRDSAGDFIRELGHAGREQGRAEVRSDDLLRMAEKAPVTQLMNLILLDAVKARASDIHIEPFESTLRLRYRVDGRLYEQAAPSRQMELALVSRLKVMAHMDIAEKRLPQDGMAKVRVGEKEIDIRVSTVPVAEGERVVLRLLDRGSALLPLEQLGMPRDVLLRFREVLDRPYGLVLVTGPTGSGKTTTLYAALQELDRDSMNIMTIEDPIEYQITGIGQIQVKPKIGLTFASGLRHVLRQDPDVILVGETRDVETAETAARASLTGHLVFTTVHTNDAVSAVVRLTDMGIEPYLLAASLRAVLAQRLVRRLCVKCRKPCAIPESEMRRLGIDGQALAGGQAWEAVGCPECLGGYRGRVGIYELATIDEELQQHIRSGRCSVVEMRRMSRSKGMKGLAFEGVSKIVSGMTDLPEVLHVLGPRDDPGDAGHGGALDSSTP